MVERSEMSETDAHMWGALCHVSGLAGGLLIPGIGHLLAPLVIWLIKRHDSPFVDEQGKEALNFQITMTLYLVAAVALVFVLVGIPLLLILAAAELILVVIATVKASNGEAYRYPLTLRLIK